VLTDSRPIGEREPPCRNQIDQAGRFDAISSCNRQTDERADRHTSTTYTTLAQRWAVKIKLSCREICRGVVSVFNAVCRGIDWASASEDDESSFGQVSNISTAGVGYRHCKMTRANGLNHRLYGVRWHCRETEVRDRKLRKREICSPSNMEHRRKTFKLIQRRAARKDICPLQIKS